MDFFGFNNMTDFDGFLFVFYAFWNPAKIQEILMDL